ncbi:MAG: hypothetical protein JXR63_05185 [Spirochaetales bacterium]|nr:hypothetical protein [Spirochaetales bacterium]
MKRLILCLMLILAFVTVSAQGLLGGDKDEVDAKNKAAISIENFQNDFNNLIAFDKYSPKPYDFSNMPEAVIQLRRFESIFFGALPLLFFIGNTAFSAAYNPPDLSSNATDAEKADRQKEELTNKGILIGSVVGASIIIAITDIIIYNKKRNDKLELLRQRTEAEKSDPPAIIDSKAEKSESSDGEPESQNIEDPAEGEESSDGEPESQNIEDPADGDDSSDSVENEDLPEEKPQESESVL